jgi:hypothetical protein
MPFREERERERDGGRVENRQTENWKVCDAERTE